MGKLTFQLEEHNVPHLEFLRLDSLLICVGVVTGFQCFFKKLWRPVMTLVQNSFHAKL